jgi:hypothetical protein
MAKHKKNELRHNWRSIYLKILKNFRDTNFILGFNVIKSINVNEIQRFEILTKENINLRIYFYKSNHREQINIAEDFFDQVSIMVGTNARPKILEVLLKTYIKTRHQRRLLGINNENLFLSIITENLNKNNLSKIVKVTDIKDEFNGIDFYITYKNKIVPLQLKSSESEQSKHKNKHFVVPSFIFAPEKYTNEQVTLAIIKICNAYSVNRILHI